MLRLVVKTTPSQWRVSRELRERIKLAFDGEEIEIPFPQQDRLHKNAELLERPATASPRSRPRRG